MYPDTVLMERDAEQTRLLGLLDGLRAGSAGVCVLVHGEAGIGKTSLLREVQRRGGVEPQWLWGSCEPLLSAPPFAPLLDLLDQVPPSLAAAVRSGHQACEVLGGVLQMLRERGSPSVLLIDDVQWADDATLDLLRYVGGRIESTPAMLVLLYRDTALASDHPLRGVLGSLPARCTVRIALQSLSQAAVAELAQRSGRHAGGLYDATQGNPFFVTELLAGEPDALPASVRDAVLARAGRLSPAARELLDLVSVAPSQLEHGVAEAVLEDTALALAEAAAAGLLRGDGAALRFRHELARRSIEAALPAERAAGLHAAVFDTLSLAGAPAARLVHHAPRAKRQPAGRIGKRRTCTH